MTALIDALLELSRLSRGDLERKPVDLTRVARSVLAQLTAAEPQRAIEVQVDDGMVATADVRLVRTLLENLIGNAWKFTGKTASPRIEIGSTDERTFYVRDNGAGFDLVHAGKLFSPFERLHPDEEFPGTGIGLTTVQRIVHRHGGKIWVLARVNAGATFFFTLAPD
jgi:light-regulated signal transduction histidine kinase (bacteriophytochrome)